MLLSCETYLGCEMAQTSQSLAPTSEAQVKFQASPRGICGGKVTLGQVCLQVLQFPLHCQYHSSDTPYSYNLNK